MADVTVTAASVAPTATTSRNEGTAGATITAGQPLYKDSAASYTLKPAISTSVAASACVGIALHGASSGQPIAYATRGDVTFNAAFTQGIVYAVSAAAAGGIAPISDITTGDYPCILGVATSTTNLKLGITTAGVVI